jgi:hypothetical protein
VATKPKGTIRKIMDTLGALVRQPMSDESNETPTPAAVRRSKSVAAGPRSRAATAKVKKRAASKRAGSKRTTKKR